MTPGPENVASTILSSDMEITTGNILMSLCALSVTTIIMTYVCLKYAFTYWKKKGITYVQPHFPLGNVADAVRQEKSMGEMFKDIYNQLDGHDFGGVYIFNRPVLVVRDPEIIKTMLVKDFTYLPDRGLFINEEIDPLAVNLFTLTGIRWKNMRNKLSPTFTPGKMKMMFQIFVEIGNELGTCVEEFTKHGKPIEMKDVLAKYSTDIIASTAFGITCNCLKNPNSEFRQWGRKIYQTSVKSGIRDLAMFLSPTLASILKIPYVPSDVTRYFKDMVYETVTYRETHKVTRNDFMQLLINLKNGGNVDMDHSPEKQMNGTSPNNDSKEFSLNMDNIAAEAFAFFDAGFSSTSITMTFCLYELAMNPDVQEKLQSEIDFVLKKHGCKITYEAIEEMDYLDKIISETLRKYPPAPFITRECSKTYIIPETKVTVEKGLQVIIPIMGMQHDAKYFPNPEKFDPERFTEDEKSKRHKFTHLPFGEGPRICIGMRFGLLQTKVGLVSLLRKNSFQVCDKTTVPPKLDPKIANLALEGGMWLRFVRRN